MRGLREVLAEEASGLLGCGCPTAPLRGAPAYPRASAEGEEAGGPESAPLRVA